jgi:hypothetical protein
MWLSNCLYSRFLEYLCIVAILLAHLLVSLLQLFKQKKLNILDFHYKIIRLLRYMFCPQRS